MANIVKGIITSYDESGTAVIKAKIDTGQYIHQQVKEVYVEPIDSRKLSDKQRKMCYAMINAIADYSGSNTQDIKEYFKMEFWSQKLDTLNDRIFSLSNAPMSLVAEFQKFLIRFVLENNVPTKRPLLEYADDIDNYVYMCLIHKKCAVCNRPAELHHIDRIGMGGDRTKPVHIGKEAMSLCREHHREFHDTSKQAFFEKYHFDKGVIIDKTIAKIYGLPI